MRGLLSADTIRAIQRQREMGLGWRYDGLGDWTTDAIFAKLGELSINADRERFAEQAQRARRCSVLHKSWAHDKERYDLWDDFPFMAAEELWFRLTPDLLCPEIISRRLDEVIRASEMDGGYINGVEMSKIVLAAMPLMDYLESLPADERVDGYEEVCECSPYDYSSCLLEAIMNYGGDYPDEVTRLADMMSVVDPDNAASYQGDLPFALARAGRREEALARIQANLERFPEDIWIQVHAGDVYEELGDNEGALQFYVSALNGASDPFDWDVFRDRAKDVLHKMGRTEDWARIQRDAPRPAVRSQKVTAAAPSSPSLISPLPQSLSAPPGKRTKVGANDPCPCGSGKKYKKCCRR